jgi:hypothetical protein
MTRLFTLFIFLLHLAAHAQSKKDLQGQIDSLEIKNKQILIRLNASDEKHKVLESELKNVQINLTNTTTTLSLVTKTNLDLEAQVKSQSQLIQKLIAQNDSLLRSFTANGAEEKFVTLPKNETDSIIYVIQNYYKSKKWEDRLQYVINADKVKPIMADAYKDQFKSSLVEKSKINVPGSNYENGKTFKVFVDGNTFYLTKTVQGFKIDWEATIGYNEISLASFESEKSKTNTVFRAEIYLNSTYWEGYGIAPSNYLSLIIDHIGVAYIALTNSRVAELKKLLADGKGHEVIVEVQYKTISSSDGYSTMDFPFVTKFVKSGWDK